MRKTIALSSVLVGLSLGAYATAAPLGGPLLDAVRNGDHGRIRALLTQGANVNERLYDQSTVLSWAIDRQDEQSVDLLLKAGAKADIADAQGTTPVIIACQGGSPGIVQKVLAAGASAKVARWDGVSALSLCAAYSTADVLERMIAAGASPDTPNAQGQTPVMYAASQGKADNVAVLVKHGADINRATPSGFTSLFFAVKSGVAGAPQAIVTAGANPSYVAPDGTTALHLALLSQNTLVAEYLIERGANVNTWNIQGKQPLQVAVEKGDLKLAKLLLAKGANPNALTKAAFKGIPMADAGPVAGDEAGAVAGPGGRGGPRAAAPTPADPDWTPRIVYRQVEGLGVPTPPAPSTPLLAAVSKGNVELVKTLVAAGADPKFRASDGANILLAAAGSGSLEALKFAAQSAPDFRVVLSNGSNALHIALQNSRAPETEAIIRYLVDNGAPLDGKNARGQTPSDLAQRATPQIKAFYAKLLQDKGAKTVALVSPANAPQRANED
jgi:ankyrin repeat protein